MNGGSKIDIEKATFEEFLANEAAFIQPIKDYWEDEFPLVTAEMNQQGYSWIIVCRARLVAFSKTMVDVPDREELLAIGKKYNGIPMLFTREVKG